MGRHDSAPTHGWVIGSQVNKWLALAFIIIVMMLIAESIWIVSAVKRDCQEPYKSKKTIGNYWFVVHVGSTKNGCGNPY